MTLVRRNAHPFELLHDLLRTDPFVALAPTAPTFHPQFDVREIEGAFVIRADLPGVRDEDLDISVTGNALSVTGKRESDDGVSAGTFERSFTLPSGVDGTQVSAELTRGVLKLTVPKRPEMQPRKVAIQIGAAPTAKQGGTA